MSLEKPWAKPFQILVEKLHARYDGKIIVPDAKSAGSSYVYPSVVIVIDGLRFEVEITELAEPVLTGGYVGVAARDNIEFLHINVLFKSDYSIYVTHETISDRLEKFLHLEHEFQTGNNEFDKQYLIKLGSREEEKIVSRGEFRELIKILEPFKVLAIISTGLYRSENITNKKQLEFDKVNNCIITIKKIVSLIQNEEM